MEDDFLRRLRVTLPDFAAKLGDGSAFDLEQVQPPASDDDLRELEESLGLTLPESYKSLLRCGREFWLLGGVVQFGFQHPFFHEFDPPDKRTPRPSRGMVCFAEFFMEADGDQVLFDVSRGLVGGEYPVMYYAHESRPPAVRLLAATFPDFLAGFLDYPALARDDGDD